MDDGLRRLHAMRGLLTLLLLAALLGCATPYQRLGRRGGYTDHFLGNDTYYVVVRVNRWSEEATAFEYFHRRASDIVRAKGYEGYELIEYRAYEQGGGYRAYGRIKCHR
jgi:hypothetical protein